MRLCPFKSFLPFYSTTHMTPSSPPGPGWSCHEKPFPPPLPATILPRISGFETPQPMGLPRPESPLYQEIPPHPHLPSEQDRRRERGRRGIVDFLFFPLPLSAQQSTGEEGRERPLCYSSIDHENARFVYLLNDMAKLCAAPNAA